MVGFVASAEDLTFAGKLLEDSKTLACYNIKENSLLEMLPLNFTIFLKNLSDKTLVLKVCKEDRALDVKKKISDEEGFPVRDICLIFARSHWRMIKIWLATMLRKIPFSIGFYNCMADFAVKKGTAMVAWKSFKHASVFQRAFSSSSTFVKEEDRDGSLEELQACLRISGLYIRFVSRHDRLSQT
ncbi:hypothetical protein RHSIM_Rhsim02G0040900 [Rhododendron simsii]|uniref:Ubiquitin-like domain-containing protein n=1 Tax=Rhododendron simsii TaxID=118357 RepID=A0A834HBA2_RHOSS|nr:hypothetical protein RHSIM_Rhsim02G0040900 [Rhododendron simsii]